MTKPTLIRSALSAPGAVATAVSDTLGSLGAPGARIRAARATLRASDHFDGSRFRNIERDSPVTARGLASVARRSLSRSASSRPTRPIPVAHPDFSSVTADLAATWLGHASVAIEIDGRRILADPMFSDRASPSHFIGPRRRHASPVPLTDLPAVDAVVISHDHYDHLDRATIIALTLHSAAPFLVPLGVGAHLAAWGVPRSRIVELDWGTTYLLGPVRIVCTPARHFSGRRTERNATLWASWTLIGTARRAFFGGDTGYTAAFAETGREYGPFDLTMLPIGAYDEAWPDIHMTPEQALQAHRDLRGRVLLPIHWATFDLAPHPRNEPIERLLAAGESESLLLPRPGSRVTPDRLPAREIWWR